MESALYGSTARYLGRTIMGNPFAGRNKLGYQTKQIGAPTISRKTIMKKQPGAAEDVDMLMNSLNDKAFIFKSGRVDILKNGDLVIRKFPNKKDAYLYLLKAGWKYV